MNAFASLAEERLLIEAAQQDPGRFAELYSANFNRVYAFVIRRTSNRTEAEDVTAEVFHQALMNIGRFQWRGLPFSSWLLRIAANTLADRWHKTVKQTGESEGSLPELQAPSGSGAEVEQRAMLFQLVDRLPADQRLVIVRRFVDQKSVREIANELGRSEGAVKQLQYRALEDLRAKMGDRHE